MQCSRACQQIVNTEFEHGSKNVKNAAKVALWVVLALIVIALLTVIVSCAHAEYAQNKDVWCMQRVVQESAHKAPTEEHKETEKWKSYHDSVLDNVQRECGVVVEGRK